MAVPVERRMKRWQEQRWILDHIIRTVGIEWDQPRIAYTAGPCGPEANFDFNLVRQRVTKLADMPREYAAAARRREAVAERYEKEGRLAAARESYFIAALLWGSVQWSIFENSPSNLEFNAHKVHCYQKYAAYAPNRIERVENPFGRATLPAYLHLPRGWNGEKLPCVLTIDGMDGFKEIMHAMYGDKILERGLASLAIDGPGQGECCTRGIHVTATNFKDAGRAALDWLRRRPEVDPNRMLVYGISFGSFWATQVATVDDGLRGCAVAYVCHEPGGHTIFNMASPTFKLRFMYMASIEDEEEFDRFTAGMTLDGSEVKFPYLVIAGEDDELSPIEHTYRLFDQIKTLKQLVVYQGERHAIGGLAGGLGPNWMTLLADWLRDRADGKPMASERVYVDMSGQQRVTSV
jgi:dienelactone hydrolase